MKKISKFLILILVLGIIFNANSFVLGENGEAVNIELKQLNNEIANKKDRLKEIEEEQQKYSQSIKQKQNEKVSLANQLAILDSRIMKAELEIERAEIEIDQTNLEIKKTNLEIEAKTKEIEKEKEHISNVLKLMYEQDQVSSLEILLLNNSLSDFLNQMKYLEDVSEDIGDSLDNLKKYQENLENDKKKLDKKNLELASQKEKIEEEKLALKNESGTKVNLLDQVKNSESQYQSLLAQAKQEQASAAADIASLEKSVRAKIAQMEGKELEFNDKGLIWPVPKNVITAGFHDPDYPFRYLFEHPAIDIRAEQGTPLKAAASGYVARVQFNGTDNYAYIMIIHGDGLSTVYGHVSKVYVSEDEYVVQGQAIGLSGGMPGTPGAGRLTTGSHLHFEVRSNGIPVNPLEYLP